MLPLSLRAQAPAKSLGIGIQLLAQGLVVKEVDDDAALNEGLEGDLKVQVGDMLATQHRKARRIVCSLS